MYKLAEYISTVRPILLEEAIDTLKDYAENGVIDVTSLLDSEEVLMWTEPEDNYGYQLVDVKNLIEYYYSRRDE